MSSINQFYQNLLHIKSDFQKLFFQNEYNSLRGETSRSTLTLALILFLTLMALSFAVGSLEYLGKRMDNPFTNWVNLPISPDIEDVIPEVKDYFEDQDNRDSFSLKGISDYSRFHTAFINYENEKRYFRKGRTVYPTDDILKKILSSEGGNVIGGKSIEPDADFAESDLCGFIVTLKMLEELGYDNPGKQKKILVSLDADTDTDTLLNVWFDVISVVKELPDLSDFLSFPVFYNLNRKSFRETGFANFSGKEYSFTFLSQGAEVDGIKQTTESELEKQNLSVNSIRETQYEINSSATHYLYRVTLNEMYSVRDFDAFFQPLRNALPAASKARIVPNTSCLNRFNYLEHPYSFTFNFEELDQVRAFKEFMLERFKIEISMSQIESKENFFLVSSLTSIISIILFVFGTLSIVFFVDSLLKTHLQKIKPNLGTFKAFGLSNGFLVSTYLKIIVTFLGRATLIALFAAVIVDIGEDLFRETSFLKLLSAWVILALLLLFFISYWKSKRTISHILTNTPGDLIYSRN